MCLLWIKPLVCRSYETMFTVPKPMCFLNYSYWLEMFTSLSKCPLLMFTPTISHQAFETWENPERECSVCSCFNGEAVCSSVDECSTTPPLSGVTAPVQAPLCGWSDWMNENTPSISEYCSCVQYFNESSSW